MSYAYYVKNILINLGSTATTFLYGICLLELSLLLGALFNRGMYRNYQTKTVHIIRGVPGIGKKTLVAQLEADSSNNFALVDRDEYFITDGEYQFKGSELSKADHYSRSKFLTVLGKKITNIYVIGYFNEIWMYQEYVDIAKLLGYRVTIKEIPCVNIDSLTYFNTRCAYNTPLQKSIKCYNTWQEDVRAEYYEAFIPAFPGDTLPKKVSKITLDAQLDNYWGKTDSDTEVDTFQFDELIEYDATVASVSDAEYNEVFKRDYSFNMPLDGRYDLREDRPIRHI